MSAKVTVVNIRDHMFLLGFQRYFLVFKAGSHAFEAALQDGVLSFAFQAQNSTNSKDFRLPHHFVWEKSEIVDYCWASGDIIGY